jgi:hypothetical protein
MQNIIPEARVLTSAERADEAARMERALLRGRVRRGPCPLCCARPFSVCQVRPPGDHLSRWLAAYTAKRITRAELTAVVGEPRSGVRPLYGSGDEQ